MAKLTAKGRSEIATKNFAGPGRTYPDENRGHAKAALSDASKFASSTVKAEVRANVHKKYPSMGKSTAVGREVEKRLAARDKK